MKNINNDNLRPAIVVIVEDNDADVLAITESFESEDIYVEFETFATADDALVRLLQKPIPDIIFIDQNLTGSKMSGKELTLQLCVNQLFIDTQIVVMTEVLTEKERAEFTEAHLRAFIPKPLNEKTLRLFVKDNKNDFIFQLMRKVKRAA